MREWAVLALDKIEKDGAYTDKALKTVLAGKDSDSRNIALTTEIVYGVISNKTRIDYIIGKYASKIPSGTLLNILRTGIYQLFFLDKIPDNAAVNESVELAKKLGYKNSSGFVNAVLRNALRNGEGKYPSGNEYYEIYYSHPKWLVNMLFKQYGDEAVEIIKSNNTTAPTTVRLNTLKKSGEEICKELTESGVVIKDTTEENIIEISKFGNMATLKAYSEGLITPQDLSAYKAAKALTPQKGEIIYDLCSAPGGKSTAIAELSENGSKIYSFDIHPHKIELIEKNAQRLGITCITAQLKDSSVYDPALYETADKVLADVPCSGLGIIRKKPDIKWQDAFSKLDELQQLQQKILKNAGLYLKKGGILVYSTCTINKKENEKQTEEFLKNGGFTLISQKTYLPHKDNSDGFFISIIKKDN